MGKEHIADPKSERYTLDWAGKSAAYRVLQEPTTNTLIPCREESVDFDDTHNLFIEAENLEALKILQKAYAGQVKMIYIDPPYNTGNDSFIYPDKFSESREEYAHRVGDTDDKGYLKRDGVFQGAFRKNAKDNGHYHSNWLNMMLPRLHLAKTLLADDGVIFISIDDNEQAQLKLLCDEVFGEENFVGKIISIANPGGRDYNQIAVTHEYLFVYSKTSDLILNEIEKETEFEFHDDNGGYITRDLRNRNPKFHRGNRPNLYYPFYVNPNVKDKYGYCEVSLKRQEQFIEVFPLNSVGKESVWRWGSTKSSQNIVSNSPEKSQIVAKRKNDGNFIICEKHRKNTTKIKSVWDETEMRTENGTRELRDILENSYFDHPKSLSLLKKCCVVGSLENSLILDFFSGSGTTAHAVMQLNAEDGGNRRYICVQLPEETDEKSEAAKAGFATIAEIAKERIRRAGAKIKAENPNQTIDTGFKVFKLSESHFKQWKTHLTSKEIATPATQARNDGLNSGSLNGTQQLDLLADFQDVVQNGATLENMAYEIALRLGFQLTDEFDFSGSIVWLDNHQKTRKMALLLKQYHQDLLDEILSAKPVKVFALDKIFNGDDALKVNTALQLQDANIDFETL